MQRTVMFIYKGVRAIYTKIALVFHHLVTWLLLYSNNIQFKQFSTSGIPYLSVSRDGWFSIDQNFRMHNGNMGNPIGRPQRCVFTVGKGASLSIGKNVGLSSTALVAHQSITIGDNVKIGAGVCIYDTDFHALDAKFRMASVTDFKNKKCKEVIIEDNVFIGAHATILKGVRIGENSIVGACAVVTKEIPPNEIWGGNPAIFIKKLINDEESIC
ncbi:acyltransferase [Sunxiuqinia elliptica]|nr:acyltransferase [Sunxiuqinia elliptica]